MGALDDPPGRGGNFQTVHSFVQALQGLVDGVQSFGEDRQFIQRPFLETGFKGPKPVFGFPQGLAGDLTGVGQISQVPVRLIDLALGFGVNVLGRQSFFEQVFAQQQLLFQDIGILGQLFFLLGDLVHFRLRVCDFGFQDTAALFHQFLEGRKDKTLFFHIRPIGCLHEGEIGLAAPAQRP